MDIGNKQADRRTKETDTHLEQDRSVVSHKQYRLWSLFLVGFVFLLYANTLFHEFTQDDAIVIYDNMYTTEGIRGIPGLLSKDTFYGFFKEEGKAALVSGGRYRPLTPVMFAVEWELFGNNPFFFHLMNVLLYCFLGIICLNTLPLLLKNYTKHAFLISLAASFVFLAHPLHTEVVANVKGRDEIMSMIGSLLSLYSVLKFSDTQKLKWLLLSGLTMFLACMSKENAITFLAVIPLALYFFRSLSFAKSIRAIWATVLGAFMFLIIRTMILGFDLGGAPNELMNNPYLKLVNGSYVPFDVDEKLATILFTLGKYIQLLFFPHPLTHDYYPRHVDIMQFSDVSVILSGVMYLILIVVVILGIRKKDLPTFSILYFLITLSIVSNIVFPIGTNMSERFMFMPSLGFALGIAYLLHILVNKKSKWIYIGLIGFICSLYSVKTVTRNMIWKNDFTLFNTDIAISKNSAKLLNAVGGSLSTAAGDVKDKKEKNKMYLEALKSVEKAIQIHPTYKNAYLIKGNCQFYLNRYEDAIQTYTAILSQNGGDRDASKNLGIALREQGRTLGSSGNVEKALPYLTQANSLLPNDYEILKLLGIANGFSKQHNKAIQFFEEALALLPNSKEAHANLSKAYQDAGNVEKANYHSGLAK